MVVVVGGGPLPNARSETEWRARLLLRCVTVAAAAGVTPATTTLATAAQGTAGLVQVATMDQVLVARAAAGEMGAAPRLCQVHLKVAFWVRRSPLLAWPRAMARAVVRVRAPQIPLRGLQSTTPMRSDACPLMPQP